MRSIELRDDALAHSWVEDFFQLGFGLWVAKNTSGERFPIQLAVSDEVGPELMGHCPDHFGVARGRPGMEIGVHMEDSTILKETRDSGFSGRYTAY